MSEKIPYGAEQSGAPKPLQHYRILSRLADDAVRVPIIGVRVGVDPLLGLIPGVGDLAGGVLAAYGLLLGWRLGAPAGVLFRMLLNIAIDTLIGEIPLAGDLFDFGWKSNTRNYRLLERYLVEPNRTRRESGLLLAALGLLLFGILAVGAWLAYLVVAGLIHLLGGI